MCDAQGSAHCYTSVAIRGQLCDVGLSPPLPRSWDQAQTLCSVLFSRSTILMASCFALRDCRGSQTRHRLLKVFEMVAPFDDILHSEISMRIWGQRKANGIKLMRLGVNLTRSGVGVAFLSFQVEI